MDSARAHELDKLCKMTVGEIAELECQLADVEVHVPPPPPPL